MRRNACGGGPQLRGRNKAKNVLDHQAVVAIYRDAVPRRNAHFTGWLPSVIRAMLEYADSPSGLTARTR